MSDIVEKILGNAPEIDSEPEFHQEYDSHLFMEISENVDPSIDFGETETSQPRRKFQLTAAHRDQERRAAAGLVSKMYQTRGYGVRAQKARSQQEICLSVMEHQEVLATLSIGVDGPMGLKLESTFPLEVSERRSNGRRLCEFTQLAADPLLQSKSVIAALFHSAYIMAHFIRQADTLLIEVNPRHVFYYRRMLGFKVASDKAVRNNVVGAPSVLLELILEDARLVFDSVIRARDNLESEKITPRSSGLYADFFGLEDEAGIIDRLKKQFG